MKQILLIMLLMTAPAVAQTQLAPQAGPRSTSARAVDLCAPIGRTANGELVYSMRCDHLPVPPTSAQAKVKEAPTAAPPPEPEVQRGGLFGWSYDRRPKSE